MRFLDHTEQHTTVGRTPMDEWSAHCRDLYLTTSNTHIRQTSMPQVGFEGTISAGKWPQTYTLDHTITATACIHITPPPPSNQNNRCFKDLSFYYDDYKCYLCLQCDSMQSGRKLLMFQWNDSYCCPLSWRQKHFSGFLPDYTASHVGRK